MTVVHSLILGIVQGLTEFLPVSSSAHLTFAEQLFKFPADGRLSYDVLLHLGTTLALLVFFGRRIVQIVAGLFSADTPTRKTNWNLVLVIAVGTVPAGVIGYLVRHKIDTVFADVRYSAAFLLVTGVMLFLTRKRDGQRTSITWQDGLIIGAAQAIALLPGISRSGSTIAAALFIGLARPEAFEFSFLLSIPAVLGAGLLKLKDSPLLHSGVMSDPAAAIGFGASCLVGLLALFLVRKILLQRRFWMFSIYCWAMGLFVLTASFLRSR
jgi:undecaprenyl-diphosphatase